VSECNIPSELRYARSHEWVRSLAHGQVEVDITDHAPEALGDLMSVEALTERTLRDGTTGKALWHHRGEL
jgi:glycine cleavage system H lipoate-binding protein